MAVSEINQLARSFNWNTPSWDLFIFLFWGVASMIYAFSAGRGRIINILISIYMAKLLVLEAPFLREAIMGKLPAALASIQQLAVFVILFLVLFIFLGRYAFRTSVDSRHFASIIFSLVFSILQIGLLINTVLTLLPLPLQQSFSELIQIIFIKGSASFVWLVAPLVYLIIFGKHVADANEI